MAMWNCIMRLLFNGSSAEMEASKATFIRVTRRRVIDFTRKIQLVHLTLNPTQKQKPQRPIKLVQPHCFHENSKTIIPNFSNDSIAGNLRHDRGASLTWQF